jgi:hypothetical protein
MGGPTGKGIHGKIQRLCSPQEKDTLTSIHCLFEPALECGYTRLPRREVNRLTEGKGHAFRNGLNLCMRLCSCAVEGVIKRTVHVDGSALQGFGHPIELTYCLFFGFWLPGEVGSGMQGVKAILTQSLALPF